MARIRTIKPGFFKNEDLAELSFECRLLFVGLWTLADVAGRLEDRPKRIKADIFPYDNIEVDVLLSSLDASGFITRYSHNNQNIIQVVTFKKHQRITGTEAATKSEFPEFSEETQRKHFGNTSDDWKGKEGKGREGERKQETKTVSRKKAQVKPALQLIFINRFSDAFSEVWERWLTHRKEQHGFTFKSSVTLQSNHDLLFQMSGGNEQKAIDIVNYSIAGTWKSFQLPEKHKNHDESSTKGQYSRTGKATNQQVNGAFANWYPDEQQDGTFQGG